jgi:hypothetical protein
MQQGIKPIGKRPERNNHHQKDWLSPVPEALSLKFQIWCKKELHLCVGSTHCGIYELHLSLKLSELPMWGKSYI